MKQYKLALVVPDGIVRAGIETLIVQSNGSAYHVEGFDDLQAFMAQSSAILFDLVLIEDSGMAREEVVTALGTLNDECPHTRAIVISSRLNVHHIRSLIKAGAKGFVYRAELAESLLNSIELVLRDTIAMSHKAMVLVTYGDQLAAFGDLTPFDNQVLKLTAHGLNVKQIALRLGASTRSVYRSRAKLRDVLNVATNETIVDAAREQGLLDE